MSATVIFLVKMIKSGRVSYEEVIKKYPDLKEQINTYLKNN